MRTWVSVFGFIFLVVSVTHAQERASSDAPLNKEQLLGQRLFQQRCSACHMPSAHSKTSYGSRLYNYYVEDNEAGVRETIMNGVEGRMPGWKYTLQPQQIDAIIEYLKTVNRPVRPKT
jgi:mono/diheme cytochrome c family protein